MEGVIDISLNSSQKRNILRQSGGSIVYTGQDCEWIDLLKVNLNRHYCIGDLAGSKYYFKITWQIWFLC